MAATGSITLQQLLRHPFVLKVISQLKPSGAPLSSYYRIGLGNSASRTIPAGVRSYSYDIFNHTRRIASVRPAETGPARRRPQKVGVGTGTILRAYESLPITYERIVNMRPLGASIGTLDKTGQSYVAKQTANFIETFRNLREWSVARMFRGGFDIKITDGEVHYVTDIGSGDIQVRFNFPAAHLDQLAITDAGTDVIADSWDDPTADIVGQFFELNRAAERISGYSIEECWTNTRTLGYLFNNTALQAAGGSAYRVWDSAEWKDMKTIDGGSRRRGLDVVFRAMPWITFHAYDGRLQKGSAQQDSTAAADTELVIPDGKALMTPAPGDWIEFAQGQEMVNKTYTSAPELVTGFESWSRLMFDPDGRELRFLDNFSPYAPVPMAWFFPTVVFT